MILEKINSKLKEAIISKDSETATFIRFVKGEFDRIDKDKLDENKIISILKNLKDSAMQSDNKFEIDILEKFLPRLLNDDEISAEIESIIIKNNYSTMKELGLVMKEMKEKYGSTFDGKIASNIAKEKLGFDAIKK